MQVWHAVYSLNEEICPHVYTFTTELDAMTRIAMWWALYRQEVHADNSARALPTAIYENGNKLYRFDDHNRAWLTTSFLVMEETNE